MGLLAVVRRRLLLVVEAVGLLLRALLEFVVVALLWTHTHVTWLAVTSIRHRLDAIAALLIARARSWLVWAAWVRSTKQLIVVGSIVECVRAYLIASLQRLLLLLLHGVRVCVLILVVALTSEKGAVSRR